MDLNAADGFTLGFFKQVEVDFCRCNMLMREHFTYGVNIGPACQLKHGVGVPGMVGCEWLSKEKRTGEDKT